MKQMLRIWLLLLLSALALSSCTKTDELTETVVSPAATPTAPPLAFQIPETELPLAEPGPYEISLIPGVTTYDEERADRKVTVSIYYPSKGGEPDFRGAPFPLIINDGEMYAKFGKHLASHGFIVAGISGIDTYSPWDENLFNQPLDYLFTLNQLTDNPPPELVGVIDTDHVGVWGYSFGGRNSVVLSRARMDPEYYFGNCENPDSATIPYTGGSVQKMCAPYENWGTFIQEAGPALTESEDGLWQAITDERILAVMPLSADSEWLFGPRGFASVDKAVLLTAGTSEGQRYEECFQIYKELGTTEKTFVSFVKKGHMMIFAAEAPKTMQHLAIAFFSHHLKGYAAYEYYFSEEFVSQVEDLAWGWYEE